MISISRSKPLLNFDEERDCGFAIQQASGLDDSEVSDITERIRARAKTAKTKLVTHNIKLVVYWAHAMRFRGHLDLEDLVQMGLIGLMRAADLYDPEWGTRFSTYASWWIRQAMSRGVADQGATVRVPVHMVQAISSYKRTRRLIETEFGKKRNIVSRIAEKLGWSEEYTAKVATFAAQQTVSIDEPIGAEENFDLKELLPDKNPLPEAVLIQKDIAEQLGDLVDNIGNDRLADIIKRRFGFGGVEETLEEIGRDYGVTRERIRQLEAQALKKLKKKVGVETNWLSYCEGIFYE